MSAQARQDLDLAPAAPLDPWIYADHIGVVVLDYDVIELAAECRQRLLVTDSESWSGMTLREDGVTGQAWRGHSQGRTCKRPARGPRDRMPPSQRI